MIPKIEGNPGKLYLVPAEYGSVASKDRLVFPGTLEMFEKGSPVYTSLVESSLPNSAQKYSYTFGQKLPLRFYKSGHKFKYPIRNVKYGNANHVHDNGVKIEYHKFNRQNSKLNRYVSKRCDKMANVAFNTMFEDSNIDEIAAKFFKYNYVFRDAYLNDLKVAFIHSQYVTSKTPNPSQIFSKDILLLPVVNRQKSNKRSINMINVLKKFDIRPIYKSSGACDRNLSHKKAIISSFVNRRPVAKSATLAASRQFSEELGSPNQNFPRWIINSGLRTSSVGWFSVSLYCFVYCRKQITITFDFVVLVVACNRNC